MSFKPENGDLAEKHAHAGLGSEPSRDGDPENATGVTENILHQDLRGRHMQMIAMQVQRSAPVRHCILTYA